MRSIRSINTVPWEGQSDSYRDVLYHGGIPEVNFTSFWVRKVRSGSSGSPLPPPPVFRFAHKRPELMRWVRSRTQPGIDLPSITVPALICGTWSDQGLHTRGSFEGYKQIASSKKWLYTHGRQKWGVYYSEDALNYQRAFFDHFLKGINNGFDKRPAVRLEVRESLESYQVRYERDWPIPDTNYQRLYLGIDSKGLSDEYPIQARKISYDSTKGATVFKYTFAEDKELTGNMKLQLWMSKNDGDDMDLFEYLEKLNEQGDTVHFYAKTGYTRGPVAMGWLRVSERATDTNKSTPAQPWLQHDGALPVPDNQPIKTEIEILPSSTLFRAGETLQLTVQGRDLFEHPALGHGYPVNEGEHTIHSGGEHDSHLLIPVIPPRAGARVNDSY